MPVKQLFLIRIALVVGVAAFAALTAWQRTRNPAAADAMSGALPLETLRLVLWGLAGAALAAAFFLRTRMESAAPRLRGTYLVVGWAFGEGVALFGTVQHFVGAPVTTMAIGLLTFVVTLLLLPIPPERA